MKFIVRPILSEIKALYQKPISSQRFKDYMSILQGPKNGDLKLPISGFNPMAKDHIIQKIEALQRIDTEVEMERTIKAILPKLVKPTITSQLDIIVVLNIADDLKGGWTHFYTSDYTSKFKLDPFIKRQFCIPYFWTSETYTIQKVRSRTQEYICRTYYQLTHQQPKTLKEHLSQEIFIAKNSLEDIPKNKVSNMAAIGAFYEEYKHTEKYDIIFNFFYGDIGSESLNYKKYGNKEMAGFDYAKYKSKV